MGLEMSNHLTQHFEIIYCFGFKKEGLSLEYAIVKN